jgi:hypothetical protein
MKDKALTEEEIGSIILTKKTLSKLGHGSMINVKKLCSEMGISRKAAYSYYKRLKDKRRTEGTKNEDEDDILKENMLLKERIKRLEIENRILNILKRGMEDLKKRGYLDK